TNSVRWDSSKTKVATINSSGLASGIAVGQVTITATSGTITGAASLTITALLTSIRVSPATASVPLGVPESFTATGYYYDGSTSDLTASATWTSSNPSVASISNSSGTQGVATTKASGTTQIRAAYGGVTSPGATVSVTPPALVSIGV